MKLYGNPFANYEYNDNKNKTNHHEVSLVSVIAEELNINHAIIDPAGHNYYIDIINRKGKIIKNKKEKEILQKIAEMKRLPKKIREKVEELESIL